MRGARLTALALLVVAVGCNDAQTTPHQEPPPAPPDTSAERAATAVFDAYIDVVVRGKARAACRLLVTEAARTHTCESRPTVPAEIRAAGAATEAVLVRDASNYDAHMHLSARVEPPTGSGGHLIAFLDRHGRRWLIKEVGYGHYG